MTDKELIDEARWIFAQIAQMHSTDGGDIGERCMELGRKGYALLRDRDRGREADKAPKVAWSSEAR